MSALIPLVAAELQVPAAPEVHEFAAAIAKHCGGSAEAVLFYGSCLRSEDLADSLLDFYLLVDSYERAYSRRWLAKANRMVPPNVFYAERAGLRAKYAVMTTADFAAACTARAGTVSVWARFAQPSRLVWARGDAARAKVVRAVAGAAPTLLGEARPLIPDAVSVEDLWTRAFALTYGAELRSERAERGQSIFSTDPARYAAFTAPSLAEAGLSARVEDGAVHFAAPADVRAGQRRWSRLRRRGKAVSVIRLIKASFTFAGGVDYLAWKINRHSGAGIEIKPWHRRFPLLAGLWFLPRLIRKGAVR
jgi:hypothetical protein